MTVAAKQLGMTIERKRAEAELQQLNERLFRSNSELEEFASIASHDLQEPLRKIMMFGDRLESALGGNLDSEPRLYLERMLDASRRMRQMIDDLLTYSRVRPSALKIEPVNVREIVEDVTEEMSEYVQSLQAQILVSELPSVPGDRLQLRSLFQNLIGNAIKFRHPDRDPVVNIRAQFTRSDLGDYAGWWKIEVSDNGIGIDINYYERIFALFERLHGRSEYEGTGIGLAICRRIVEQHGGEISISSIPEVGSTFCSVFARARR